MNRKDAFSPNDLLLAAVTGTLIFLALKIFLYIPYTDNEGAFVLIGKEMLRGAKLYTDIWDHKPPFLFGQSWLLQYFFPLDEFHLHAYGMLVHFLNALFIFAVALRLGFTKPAAWVSAIGYSLLLFSPLFQPWAVDADLLIQPFLLLSFWAAFSSNRWLQVLSGTLWIAAFFTKQSALFLLPVYVMTGVFSDLPKLVRWLSGVVAKVLIVSVPFALDGRWDDFYGAMIRFNEYYIESGWRFFFGVEPFRQFLAEWLKIALLVCGLPLLMTVLGMTGQRAKELFPRTEAFLAVWFLGVLVSCCSSGYFFTYYFIELLPVLALGMGLGFMKWQSTKRVDLSLCLLLIALGAGLLCFNLGGARDKVFGYAQYPTARYFADKSMGLSVAALGQPGDELLVWSNDPQIYVYAGLKPSLKTPFINHLGHMPFEAWKTYKDFETNMPRFCVVSLATQVLTQPDWLKTDLKTHYTKVNTLGELVLYEHKTTHVLK